MDFFQYFMIELLSITGTDEAVKGEDTAVIVTEGKAPEFLLKIQTETVSSLKIKWNVMILKKIRQQNIIRSALLSSMIQNLFWLISDISFLGLYSYIKYFKTRLYLKKMLVSLEAYIQICWLLQTNSLTSGLRSNFLTENEMTL